MTLRALFLLAALLLAAPPARAQTPDAPLAPGDGLPPFALPTLSGDTLRLPDLAGRVVLVDFWASWCAPCLPELPRLRALHVRHGDALAVVSIALDSNRDRLETLILRDTLDWPHVQVTDGFDAALPAAFGVVALPSTFLFDAEGTLVARGLRGRTLDDAVDALVRDGAAGR